MEAITVEVGAAAIARPTGEWERRCRAVLLGVRSRGQVRVFERRGGFDRGRIGISRTTTICIDCGASERASKRSEPRLTVSNRLYTIAVFSEKFVQFEVTSGLRKRKSARDMAIFMISKLQ